MDFRPVADPLQSSLHVMGGWACLVASFLVAPLPLVSMLRWPLVALSAWCFWRGSLRIRAWLHRSTWMGPALDDWQHYHGVRRGLKQRAFGVTLPAVALGLLFASLPAALQYVVLGLVGLSLWWVWTAPTLPDDVPPAPRTISE